MVLGEFPETVENRKGLLPQHLRPPPSPALPSSLTILEAIPSPWLMWTRYVAWVI